MKSQDKVKGIKKERQYVYLSKFEKWQISEIAKSKNTKTSNLIAQLIKTEIDKNPSLNLGLEKGESK